MASLLFHHADFDPYLMFCLEHRHTAVQHHAEMQRKPQPVDKDRDLNGGFPIWGDPTSERSTKC